ncbi:MAG: hypothetical protein IKR17_05985 [Bacteroidales bacterium]|nr:hypothetical protein [Bacteroidales bacterium]
MSAEELILAQLDELSRTLSEAEISEIVGNARRKETDVDDVNADIYRQFLADEIYKSEYYSTEEYSHAA